MVNVSAKENFYRGCLLGLAVGDALGYSVDDKSWEQICEDYGPNGLLGYDLQEDYADVTSYTQIAAYLSNALLLSISRRDQESRMPYICLGLKEWTRSQMFYRDPDKSFCWISKLSAFRRRHCRDARMLETLRLLSLGAPKDPKNNSNTPGALTGAVVFGLFFEEKRMQPHMIGKLAFDTMAITHPHPEATLSAVVLAYTIAGLLQSPDTPLEEQFLGAIEAMRGQFPGENAELVAKRLLRALDMARNPNRTPRIDMEKLDCCTASECLAGAMYAALAGGEEFDSAIICAVNHSGRSAATGAVAGAILGAKLGAEALPDFYLDSLEVVDALTELADDLRSATPASGIFDDDWDQKYVQGDPL